MKKLFLWWCIVSISGSILFADNFQTDFKPFYFASRPAKGTDADCSYMNSPITEKQRISVGSDGHLYSDGKRIRIFGTNIASFPPVEDAEYWAQTLASQGINCVRFHHTDADWSNCFFSHDSTWQYAVFNEKAFERFDKFFYELKKAGIYTNINLLTGRTIRANSENGLPKEFEKLSDWKDSHCYGFWNKLAQKEQQKYAEKILNHKNPYTGLTYAEDPAVAFVEINNENSMTKCYLDNVLERYPSNLSQELDVLWTDFLAKKGFNYNSLAAKFNQSEPTGKNLLTAKTVFEQHEGANAELIEKIDDAGTQNGDTTASAKIIVKSNGTVAWHIQYNFPGFTTQAEQLYTISFKAKASKDAFIDAAIMMDHAPWKNLGFDKHLHLKKQWQEFSFSVSSLQADSQPRFTIGGMGTSAGVTFEFSEIKICKGGTLVFVEKSDSGKNGQIKFPSLDKFRACPLELRQLVSEFLVSLDSDYWGSMNDYLKNSIGVKALTFGTALPCAPISVMSKFDVVDSHSYWNHPVFPHDSWNNNDYYVKNQSLTTAEDGGTLASLAKQRVYGKPFSVTEYDHPYPNQFTSEMMPMYAVFASLQDWDCIYSFCYDLSQRNPKAQKITGYFDQSSNPAKIAAMPVAARIFREYKIKPFEKALYCNVTLENERDAIAKNGSAWNVVPQENFGINQKDSLFYKIGSVVEGVKNNLTKQELKSTSQSNGEDSGLIWTSQPGYFIFENNEVYVSVTMPGASNEIQNPKNKFSFVPQDDFGCVAAVKINDSDKNSKWFVFSCSWSGNLGEKLYEYGKKPKKVPQTSMTRSVINLTNEYLGSENLATALGSNGSFKFDENSWKLYCLQQDGNRGNELKNLTINQTDKTLWYELEK